jgi:hypothetical protein
MLAPGKARSYKGDMKRVASVQQYMMPRGKEIEIARSAALPSLSAHAEVMAMNRTGYEVAALEVPYRRYSDG